MYFRGMAPQWRKSLRARSPTGAIIKPHRQLPRRPTSPSTTLSPARVSRSLVPDDREADTPARTIPRFPEKTLLELPPGHTARYWPSRTSTDHPCGKNDKEVSTREHLFNTCPVRPHEKHTHHLLSLG